LIEAMTIATMGLFEAKQKLSELVERARKGEEIGITRHGKLVAKIVPAEVKKDSWKAVFADLDEYRKNLKGRPVSDEEIKEWINEGRE
jgi:prevent-host-death family protein